MSKKAMAVLVIAVFVVSLLTSAVAGAAAGIMAVRAAPVDLLRGAQSNNVPAQAPGGTAPNNQTPSDPNQQPNTPNNRQFPNGQAPRGTLGGAAVVSQVVTGSPAEKAGLQVGDIIVSVNGARLDANHTLDVLIQQSKPGDTVELGLRQRGQAESTLKVTLGANPSNAAQAYLGIQFQATPISGTRPTS
ncbi:MAG: PDZ domain-containing protein [Chloroflexi bacterium]|nr:PDZ domain-containing protein [Chloroflexota bacterium]